MQANEAIKKIAVRTCVYFTVTSLLILAVNWVLTGLPEGMRPLALILILPFSLCFAAANVLLRYSKLQKALVIVLHYILTVGGIFLCLYLPIRQPGSTASGAFLFFALLTLIYAVVMAVVGVFKNRANRLKRDRKDYKSVYKK